MYVSIGRRQKRRSYFVITLLFRVTMAPPTLSVDLTLRSRIRISKLLTMLYFAQLTLAVLVIVFGYNIMQSMALFSDVVRDAYTDAYYPSVVVVCGVCTSFVSLCAIQV